MLHSLLLIQHRIVYEIITNFAIVDLRFYNHNRYLYLISINGDYTAINGETLIHNTDINRNLYNGNIARQTVHLPSDTTRMLTGYPDTSLFRLTRSLVYDQLNRIKEAKYAYFDPTTGAPTPTEQYYNTYSYDADGNIQRLIRNGNTPAHLLMDKLTYTYGDGSAYSKNQLYAVAETEDDHYDNDIKQNAAYVGTGAPTYMYDQAGNTIKDLIAGRDTIVWNLYNKVLWTTAPSAHGEGKDTLFFSYDGAGNRVVKTYKNVVDSGIFKNSEYYVRDASGNILATYKYDRLISQYDGSVKRGHYFLASHDIYGSSRLGAKIYFPFLKYKYIDELHGVYDTATLVDRKPWYSLELQDQINMEANTPYNNSLTSHYAYTHILGQKRYELPDHLGNVMATISDMRQSMADTGGFNRVIKYYKSVDKSVSDYYPFGMLMPGRNKENGKGFIMHATSITNIPAHNYTGLSLPTGGEVLFGPIVSVSTSTTYNIATAAGGGVAYILDPMYAGVSHTYKVIVSTMTMGASFQAELYDAMGASIVTIPLYIGANNITFTPPTYDAVTMKIVSTAAGTHTIKLSSLVKDSISFLPQMSTNIISNGGEYQYGYNGQMKVNEWAGRGNHYTAEYWEYDPRAARRQNQDPVIDPSISNYAVFANSSIQYKDVLGDRKTYYDENGQHVKTTHNNWLHNKFFGTQYYVADTWGGFTKVSKDYYWQWTGWNPHAYGSQAGDYAYGFGRASSYELNPIDKSYLRGGNLEAPVLDPIDFVGGLVGGIFKGLGKKTVVIAAEEAAAEAGASSTASSGFKSFAAFKKVYGSAGQGKAWHHIVEQNADNVAQFGVEAIHNPNNLIKLEHGAGSIHAKVSGYYSSIQPFTGGQTVRKWLSTQSYDAQYEFGIQTLKNFGWTP